MEPLRISITFSTPVIEAHFPIHLDALLAWAAVEAARLRGDSDPLSAQESLPLARDLGVWCASALRFDYVGETEMRAMTKRTDLNEIAADRGILLKTAPNKMQTDSGPYRQALFFAPARFARKADAWCIGNHEVVAELLDSVESVGRLRRIGYGRVASMSVTPDDDAIDRWQRRVLPEEQEGFLPVTSPVAPPYWDRSASRRAWAHPDIV